MIRYIFILLFALTIQNSSAQTLDKYADQLYFGMLSFNPDSSIIEFVTRYVPVILKKPDSSKGGYTIYPPLSMEEPKFTLVTTSYVFDRHPYFKAHFNSGQLAITQKVYHNKKWHNDISDMKLWFEFDNEAEAKKSFKQLVDTFSSFKTLKRLTSQKGMDKAEFTDTNSHKYYNSIGIVLVTDYTLGKSHVMQTKGGLRTITEAGYKILIEFYNNLYR